MKIALINYSEQSVLEEAGKKMPSQDIFPLGLAYIASALNSNGYEVKIIDVNFMKKDLVFLFEKIKGFDVLCFSTMIGTSFGFILDMIDHFKMDYNKIVVGGPLATIEPERFLRETKCDIVVIGEGEETIIDLVDFLKKEKSLRGVKGIYFKDGGRIIRTAEREPINLDKYPFPYWRGFDMEKYFTRRAEISGRGLSIFTSRGCPFNCQFCTHPFGRKWRGRSVGNIVEEVKILTQKYKVRGIRFVDDDFMFSKDRTMVFCKELKKERLDITWMCEARANDIKFDVVKTMAGAGCTTIRLGLESGSPRMIKYMCKGVTLNMVKDAIVTLDKAGLPIKGGFMIGMPTETVKDVMLTAKLIRFIHKKTSRKPILPIYFYTPRPNTPWYEHSIKMGLKPLTLREWSEVDKMSGFFHNASEMSNRTLTLMYIYLYTNSVFGKGGFSRLIKFVTNPVKIKRQLNPILKGLLNEGICVK